ncbi:MAG: hypothetical protein QNM02_20990 [Acidimicrobiia bacterium]|nr:hypothetical protein [Acidimicrobiia bacterium]
MLLRASSDALGSEVDATAVVGNATDCGVEHGEVLEAYAVAAHDALGPATGAISSESDLGVVTAAVRRTVGDDGWVEAAMTVAVFNGLVRTADASGIPLDDGVVSATADDRDQLGLGDFAGAANSDLTIAAGASPSPGLFN